jgi:hypothetical protein
MIASEKLGIYDSYETTAYQVARAFRSCTTYFGFESKFSPGKTAPRPDSASGQCSALVCGIGVLSMAAVLLSVMRWSIRPSISRIIEVVWLSQKWYKPPTCSSLCNDQLARFRPGTIPSSARFNSTQSFHILGFFPCATLIKSSVLASLSPF